MAGLSDDMHGTWTDSNTGVAFGGSVFGINGFAIS